jgi:hypothetical protein
LHCIFCVSIPHPGDAEAAAKPRKGFRKRRKSVKLSGPEWAMCTTCKERPSYG